MEKYVIYARKSSESEDRQVQSIHDQIRDVRELAVRLGYTIVTVLTESKSAKAPMSRPVFQQMLDMIQYGKADGILCWHLNRLSRNPVDSGTIQWLLQQHALKCIRTMEREYRPEDNTLLFSVESGMANQFILDLKKNARWGALGKMERGWFPGLPPQGWVNELREHTIIVDKERFILLRKAWDLLLTGNYRVSQILTILNDEWGFRSRVTRKTGNHPMSSSGLYKMFHNPFYAGILIHYGKEYPGKHTPMVTREEFDKAQAILGQPLQPRSHKHEFAFTGMIRCGECSSAITAQEKTKFHHGEGQDKIYRFYNCTHKKNPACSQRKYIREDVLEKQIDEALSTITILPEFQQWALETLRNHHEIEVEDRSTIYQSQEIALENNQKAIDSLIEMRMRKMVTDDEYNQQRAILLKEQDSLRGARDHTEERADEWLELTEKVFNFATYARHHFATGSLQTKKEIFSALGQNFILKDGELNVEPNPWFVPIIERYKPLEEALKALEPTKNSSETEYLAALQPIISTWQGREESDPRNWFWRPVLYH